MNQKALLAAKNAMSDVTMDLMPDDDITDDMVIRVISAYEKAKAREEAAVKTQTATETRLLGKTTI